MTAEDYSTIEYLMRKMKKVLEEDNFELFLKNHKDDKNPPERWRNINVKYLKTLLDAGYNAIGTHYLLDQDKETISLFLDVVKHNDSGLDSSWTIEHKNTSAPYGDLFRDAIPAFIEEQKKMETEVVKETDEKKKEPDFLDYLFSFVLHYNSVIPFRAVNRYDRYNDKLELLVTKEKLQELLNAEFDKWFLSRTNKAEDKVDK